MVAKRHGSFALGETLLITLVGNVEIVGEIVWQTSRYGGVRFCTDLPARVVAFLGFRNRDRQHHRPSRQRAGMNLGN